MGMNMIGQRYCFGIGLAAMLGLGLGCNGSWAADKPADTQDSKPASANPVVQSASKAGVRTCLKRIDQVTSFLAQGAQASAFLFPAPNPRFFTISMEVAAPDTLAYASASFALTGNDACGAEYEAITYWPLSCKETAAKGFTQLKPIGVVLRNIQVLDGGPNMRVFLMPADKGCVAIKKEVMY
jgi:hypothetical protein